MDSSLEVRSESQAGHYVVAAAILLAAVLLIVFWRPGCCCCKAQTVTPVPTVTTLQAPTPHIAGAVIPMLIGKSVIPIVGPSIPTEAIAPDPVQATQYSSHPSPAMHAPYYRAPDEFIFPSGGIAWTYFPAASSSAPVSSSTVLAPPLDVPEPSSLAIMLVGVPLLFAFARKR